MRGLVQSGGGVKGAFELGVLEALIGKHKRAYDFMSGTSVGALNTAILCQYPNESLDDGLAHLVELWESIQGNSSIWQSHLPFGRVHGLWREGFYDSSPLAALIHANFNQEQSKGAGRKYAFGCVDYTTGEYFEATQDYDDQVEYVIGSSAFPGFFTPVQVDGRLVIDGGARRVTPLKSAIMAGCDEIDVILTGPRKTKKVSGEDNFLGTKISAVTILLRTLELLTDELFIRDIKMCELHNTFSAAGAGDKRYVKLNVYEPEEPLLDGTFGALEFDPKEIERMRLLGRKVGLEKETTPEGAAS